VITFTWTSISGIDGVDILVFDPNTEARTRVGEVKISAERYEYTMKWDGEHLFRFKPLNGGKEVDYPVNAQRSEAAAPEKPVITPPATGPAENLLFLLVLTGLAYVGYRKYKTQDSRR
jgi:hypothetical protein